MSNGLMGTTQGGILQDATAGDVIGTLSTGTINGGTY